LSSLAPYGGIFRIRFIAGMQYRAAAWAGVATQFFWGFITLLVFYAFYEGSGGLEAPMSFSQLGDYIWMRQAFLALVMLWSMDNELLDHIASGNVAYELVRPLSLYVFWFARILAFRISRTLMRCFPILVVTFFLPSPWGFNLPAGTSALALFLPSLMMAALLATALSMIICLITFYTLSPLGSRLLLGIIADFLMGSIIPIPFMPLPLQRFCALLPFQYTADFPFRVYSGHIGGSEALWGLAIQGFWFLALIVLGALGFRAAQRQLVLQGG